MRKKVIWLAVLMAAVLLFGAGCGIIEGQNYTLYKYIDTVYSLAPQKLIESYSSINIAQAAMSVSTIMIPSTYELTSTINYSYSAFVPGGSPGSGTVQKVSGSVAKKGTAFMINENGYLLTNAHVVTVDDESSLTELQYESWNIKIKLADSDAVFDASVMAYDTRQDLAILRINTLQVNPSTLSYAVFFRLDDPDDNPDTAIYYGEPVIAVGNSCGEGLAVMQGLVSKPRRQFVNGLNSVSAVQTDIAVNFGSSGGPLCNIYGRVIGMNTSKLRLSDQSIGFAIPAYAIFDYIDSVNSGTSEGVVLVSNLRVRYYHTALREYAPTNVFSNF